MKTSAIDLTFPVIAFSKDGTILVARKMEDLTTCTPKALKNGYYDRLRILTVDGRQFVVKAATKFATSKPWWRPPLSFSLVTVDLQIEENGRATLEELKRLLLKAFKADRAIWEESLDYSEFAAEVNKCRSFREVTDYVGKF